MANNTSWVDLANLGSNWAQESKLRAINDTIERQGRDADFRHMQYMADRERAQAEREQHAASIQTVFAARKRMEAAVTSEGWSPGSRWIALSSCQAELAGTTPADFLKIDEKEYVHDTITTLEKALAAAEAQFPDHALLSLMDIYRRRIHLICCALVADAFRKPLDAFAKDFKPFRKVRRQRYIAVITGIFLPCWLIPVLIVFGNVYLENVLQSDWQTIVAIIGLAQIATALWAFVFAPIRMRPVTDKAREGMESAFNLQQAMGMDESIVRRRDVRPELGTGNTGADLNARLKKCANETLVVQKELDADEASLKVRFGDKLGPFAGPVPTYDLTTTKGIEAALNDEADRKIAVEDALKDRYEDLNTFVPKALLQRLGE
jgi:hypothetical protein